MGSVCPSCGAPLEHNARFCGSCGAQMGPGGQQPGGWGQSQQSYAPPPGRQQQPGGAQRGYGQQGGWQAPPPPPPSQGQWSAPASSYAGDWAPRRQQSAMPLVILLVVLLFGLAGFAYWAFFGNPPWSTGGGTVSSPIKGAISIIPTSSDNITATVTIKFETNSTVEARIDYGTDTSYAKSTEWETNYLTSHTINLTGLNFGSRYYYRILTRDKSNKQSSFEPNPNIFRAGSS